MGGCASTPKGIDLTKEGLTADTPSKTVNVVAETGNGGDVEKKEAVTVADKSEETKPEAAAAVEESPVEAVTEKKDAAVETNTEEKKAEAVVAPKAEIAEKAAESSKAEEKSDVSPPVTTA